jgi:HJR/Mrr/RecB family endonuclease
VPKSSLATDYPLTPPGIVFICFFGLGLLTSNASFIGVGIIGLLVVVGFQAQAAKLRQTRTLALQDLLSLSHRDLEHHVAAVIAALPGWQAEATRGSGDQGADVIATSPKGVRVAIQVKHYPNRNVSNGAVQEIVAAKAIYKCKEAVVFTSGPGYTKSAVELARANGVKLWRPADLFRLQAQAVAKQAAPRELLPA